MMHQQNVYMSAELRGLPPLHESYDKAIKSNADKQNEPKNELPDDSAKEKSKNKYKSASELGLNL